MIRGVPGLSFMGELGKALEGYFPSGQAGSGIRGEAFHLPPQHVAAGDVPGLSGGISPNHFPALRGPRALVTLGASSSLPVAHHSTVGCRLSGFGLMLVVALGGCWVELVACDIRGSD